MNKNIQWQTVTIENEIDGVKLKGELKFWSKDWCVTLLEPFEASNGSHLQYAVPAKFVIENSENPTSAEINILERSKEILKKLYLGEKCSSNVF